MSGEKKNDDWVKQFIKKFTYFRFLGVINATIFVVAAERKVGTENRAFFKTVNTWMLRPFFHEKNKSR